MNRLSLVYLCFFCLTQCVFGQEREKSECEVAREKALKSNIVGKLVPNCEASGEYSTLQCHHSSKFCQCWTPDGSPITTPSRQTKSCECVSQKLIAENKYKDGSKNGSPPLGLFIPQCDRIGAFAKKQCHGSTGMCWCVDEKGTQTSKDRVRGQLSCP